MEVLVLSGHICNWGLSLLYEKKSELWRPLDWVTSFAERFEGETTRHIIGGAGRAANLSGDFLPRHSVKTSTAPPYSGSWTSTLKSL